MTRNVGFVGFDDITVLDLTGPMEVFAMANALQADAYGILLFSLTGEPITAATGLRIAPQAALADAPPLDTLIVPGGEGLRDPDTLGPIAAWLRSRADTRRVASVCTGIYALAEAGLLDGRRATTHWRFAADVSQHYPKIRLQPDAIYLRDGAIFTSAGVTAGIDLALAFVEEDLGPKIALAVARELVVYLKRPGGQMQFSEPLRFQSRATDRFADLAAWMVSSLTADLSVEALADRAGMGARHFSRRFTEVFGQSPGIYVERLRMDEARERLTAPSQTVDSVAASVGYANADSFRRAFERRFGVAPSHYRGRFSA